jgi:microcystin-dependent protein
MADPFVAEIRIIPFNFAPKGWAFCDGQLMPLSQNTALFSLLGTTYGGNGQSNFALPNLQGSAPMQPGQGPGLSLRDLGETGGEETVTLLETEMPSHTHTAKGGGLLANQVSPVGNTWSGAPQNPYTATSNSTTMNPAALSVSGGSQPHNNMPPYLTFYFVIALQGVFPPRT